MSIRILLPLIALIGTLGAQAQGKKSTLVDRRDQASGWYVPVHGKVTASGGDTKNLSIKIYRENELIGQITTKRGRFTLELDLESSYSILVEKEGYLSKLVTIDTHTPDQEVSYPAYDCFLNLEPADKFTHSDPFYLDFPSAVVRWNQEMSGFYHSNHYLTDIQTKMAFLQAQAVPN
ncbi:MAG TPA: hypothetical protein VGE21_16285 [Flavobacteriales bacterium]